MCQNRSYARSRTFELRLLTTCLLLPLSAGAQLVETGLVGYYPFDGDGTDHSGTGHDATVYGAVQVPGTLGQAYSLTSGSDYIDLNLTIDVQRPFSISIWIMPTKTLGVARIVSNWSSRSTDGGFDLHYNTEHNPPLHFRLYHDGVNIASADQAVLMNQWQHVAAVWENGVASVYLNGALSERATTGSTPWLSGNTVKVGAIGQLIGRGEDYAGLVDELRVYDRGLSDAEVAALAAPDHDGDGLPTLWEQEYGLDPRDSSGESGADGDPDRDGLSNTQEYRSGNHPLMIDTIIVPIVVSIRWPSRSDTTYQVYRTTDLGSPVWVPVGDPVPGSGGVLSYEQAVSDPAKAFFRVDAVQ